MLNKGDQLMLQEDDKVIEAYIQDLRRLPGQSHHETTLFIRALDNRAQLQVPLLNDYINSWNEKDLEKYICKQGMHLKKAKAARAASRGKV
jgi:hypothetical protein